jgi:hypothetical protein
MRLTQRAIAAERDRSSLPRLPQDGRIDVFGV